MNNVTMRLKADRLIRQALEEDISSEDVSTNAVIRYARRGSVDLIVKQDGVIAGLPVYERVFKILDSGVDVRFYVEEGDSVENGRKLATVSGDMRTLLSGERVALNFLQRMSGIATYTNSIVRMLEGTKTKLLYPEIGRASCRERV